LNCVDALVGTPRIDIAQVPHTDHGSQAEQRDNRSDAELRRAGRIKTKSLHYFRLHLLVEPFGYLPEWRIKHTHNNTNRKGSDCDRKHRCVKP